MKTKYISSLLVLFLTIFFSCKKELEPQENSVGNNPSTADSTSILPNVTPGVSMNSTQNPSLLQQNANQNTSGLKNPPHGQPSHRCDIAVGAPLNTLLEKSISNPSVTNSSVPAIIKSNTTAVVTKPGMNPPHGQTGHRCDIAVGAPLNSATNKAVPVPAVPNSEVPVMLKLDSTATSPK